MRALASTRRIGSTGVVHTMADLGTDTACGRKLPEPWHYTDKRVSCVRCKRKGPKPHRHVFAGLWSHLGPYGPLGKDGSGVHIHSCFTDGCGVVLVGSGRACSGKAVDHHKEA